MMLAVLLAVRITTSSAHYLGMVLELFALQLSHTHYLGMVLDIKDRISATPKNFVLLLFSSPEDFLSLYVRCPLSFCKTNTFCMNSPELIDQL